MGFLKSKKVGNNFERQWASSTFKPQAEQLSAAGSGGLADYLTALRTGGGTAFQQYEDSTGYGGIFDEAMRGTTANLATKGLMSSGAMLRSTQDRAAELKKQSFSNYLAQLLSGSQTSLTAGQNAANTVLGANTYTRQGGLSNLLQSAGSLASGIGSLFPSGGGGG